MKTMIIENVPEDLRNEFKAECHRRGLPMRAVIIRLMELELEGKHANVLKPKEKIKT